MARIFLRIMQIITVALYFTVFSVIIGVFAGDTWQIESFGRILHSLKNVFLGGFYLGIGNGATFGGPFIDYGSAAQFEVFGDQIVYQFLNLSFYLTDPSGVPVVFNNQSELMTMVDPFSGSFMELHLQVIVRNLYLLLFIVLVFASILYMLIFIFKSDIKYSLYSMVTLIATILAALIPGLIIRLLEVIGVPNWVGEPGWTDFMTQFRIYIPEIQFTDPILLIGSIPSDVTFFQVPAVLVAFLLYLFLEFSFQTSYVARVTRPSILRTKRLESQISLLGEKSAMGDETKEEGEEGEVEKSKSKLTLRNFFTGAGVNAIKELIERRERAMEKEHLEEVTSDTRRLNQYLKRLFEVEPEAKKTLTATGSAPSGTNMVSASFMNMGFRLLVLFGLTFFIVNPIFLFQVFRVPGVIEHSVGFNSPEGIVTSLAPIVLLFPLVSFIIRSYKRYKLTQLLSRRQEESELLKKISDLRDIEEEETQFEEDSQKPAS
ncbi:MAG: hypothetical protein ACTSUE_19445 [Promethearchaeota archaeon]